LLDHHHAEHHTIRRTAWRWRHLDALKEAKRLNIPTFAIVDTNSNPRLVDFPIPANDDASKSISIILDEICGSIKEGLDERKSAKDADAKAAADKKATDKKVAKEKATEEAPVKEAPAAEATEEAKEEK